MSLLSKFDMSVKNLQIPRWTDSLLTNLASISISNIFSLFKYHLNKGKSLKKNSNYSITITSVHLNPLTFA